MEKHLIIGTAGHIDHGKTALIKMLTDIDCDTHKEEKQRGITINLGFSYLNLPGGESIGIIDVPGHRDFINTMIGGACGIDMVLLVIAADSGIMPQTKEHLNIISALGISKGVVALTKADLVDEELLEMAEFEISGFLSDTQLIDAPVIRVSAITGMGRNELIGAIADVITGIKEKESGNLFRMYIDRIFSVKGFGSVVTGSVMSGSLSAGQDVYLLPANKQKLRVRSLERHGQSVDQVVAGDRAAVNLIGLKTDDFERGMIICDKPLDSVNMIDAFVHLFDTDITLPVWSNIIFVSGTFECQARMHLLNKDQVNGNEDAIVQIHLSKQAMLMSKDKFIIRNSSEDRTLGGGYIIETSPLHHRKRTPKLIEELTRLSQSILGENSIREMIRLLLKKEFRPFTPEEIADRLSLKPGEIFEQLEIPGSGFIFYKSGLVSILVSDHYDATLRNKIIQVLADHHSKNPLFAEGLDSGEITGKLGLTKTPDSKPYLEILLKSMQREEQLDFVKNTWVIKGHQPQFDAQSLSEIEWLEHEILNYGEGKPVLAELEEKAAIHNIQKRKIKTYLSYLAGQGKIQFCKSDFIHTDILKKYRAIVLSHLAHKENGIEIQEFKELLSGTKRFRALLIDMFETEKIIKLVSGQSVETRLYITPKGINIII
ncbi:MAG: selenocysteine-specific translation elongation factor [Bacteroidales bacterium]|nr:selenocysteine-specific translation elongation factor [Bacteroidales bacterium]